MVHHALQVQISPQAARISAEDRVTLPRPEAAMFSLSDRLVVTSPDADIVAVRRAGPYRYYRIAPRAGRHQVTLRYEGLLPASEDGSGIGEEGVYLDWTDAWFPRFDGRLTFSLDVTLPEGWLAISQGQRDGKTWTERHPQEDLHLVAGRFREYRRSTPRGEALAFLRRPDDALAETYLTATDRYLEFYSRLIGPYPYAKFALVENNRETGFGMPSFTLLGPRVIRLPFIPYTSYPHEILHNWWGNGVYIDLAEGNWAEGLTSYLADHLFAEQQGRGEEYRFSALLKYADYVTTERDFPLREFRMRHSEASQAVGYNKALMFFHMLRLRLGDAAFLNGLRQFYRRHRFEPARFSHLRAAMESASGTDLRRFFHQWIERVGAPVLELSHVTVQKDKAGYRLRGRLTQTQGDSAYVVQVPVAISLEGHEYAQEIRVAMNEKATEVDLRLPARPVRVDVDPRNDVFRRLHVAERPPSLGQLFAAERPLFVLPANAPGALRAAYEELARQWSARRGGDIVVDRELKAMPDDRAIWLLGWDNRFRDVIAHGLPAGNTVSDSGGTLAGEPVDRSGHSLVAAMRTPAGGAIALIAADSPQAVTGLARKLPHYSQYSYLLFRGDAAENVRKGQWRPDTSPLVASLVAGAAPIKLAPRAVLATMPGEE